MTFEEIISKIIEKSGVAFTERIREYPTDKLKCLLLTCIGYHGVVPKEFLEGIHPERNLKWMIVKIYKTVAFYFNKEASVKNFMDIVKVMNSGNDVKSESQLLKLFKVEEIFNNRETYFSLYHHLFIFLFIDLFLEISILHFQHKDSDIPEIVQKFEDGGKNYLDLIYYLISVDGVMHRKEVQIFSELTSMVYKKPYYQKKRELKSILDKILAIHKEHRVLKVVYKIALITILIDNIRTEAEDEALKEIQEKFDISEIEHNELVLEVSRYLQENKEIIYKSPFKKIFDSFEKGVIKKITSILTENKDKIIKELEETKEMASLINKWRKGKKLTTDESELVYSQLVDVLKTVPALGIFILPGGTILLPVLAKVLPFNILPSAFAKAANISEENLSLKNDDENDDLCIKN
ncbi:hypothetical protein JXR93_06350 [bacterium]|nr:hypothetical protein [bacterium]